MEEQEYDEAIDKLATVAKKLGLTVEEILRGVKAELIKKGVPRQ